MAPRRKSHLSTCKTCTYIHSGRQMFPFRPKKTGNNSQTLVAKQLATTEIARIEPGKVELIRRHNCHKSCAENDLQATIERRAVCCARHGAGNIWVHPGIAYLASLHQHRWGGAFSEQRGGRQVKGPRFPTENTALPFVRSACSSAEPDWYCSIFMLPFWSSTLSGLLGQPNPEKCPDRSTPLCSENAPPDLRYAVSG